LTRRSPTLRDFRCFPSERIPMGRILEHPWLRIGDGAEDQNRSRRWAWARYRSRPSSVPSRRTVFSRRSPGEHRHDHHDSDAKMGGSVARQTAPRLSPPWGCTADGAYGRREIRFPRFTKRSSICPDEKQSAEGECAPGSTGSAPGVIRIACQGLAGLCALTLCESCPSGRAHAPER
jgi:hypothetical protein